MLNAKTISLFQVGFSRGMGAVSLLLFTTVIALKLDQESAGEFFFSQAIFLVGVIVCKWGADFILCKNLSVSLSKSSNTLSNIKVLNHLVNIVLLISIRLIVVVLILELLDRYLLGGRLYEGYEFYIALFLNAIVVGLAGTFQAKNRVNTYVVYQSALIPLISGMAILVFPISGVEDSWRIVCLVSLVVMIMMLVHLNHIFQFKSVLREKFFEHFDHKLFSFLYQQSRNIGADQVITAANKFGYIIAIGIFIDPVDVTYFTVIQRFSMVISFVLITVNATYSPQYAVMVFEGDKVNLRRLFLENNKLCFYAGLAIITALLALSGLLAGFYTIPLSVFVYVLMVCGIAELVNVFTGSSGLVLQLADRSRFVFLSSLFFTSFGLMISIFVSLSQNLLLVALVYAMSMAGHNLNCYIHCRDYLKQ